MLKAQVGKRPYPSENVEDNIVIDLTSDTEQSEGRPAKRQRSESRKSPSPIKVYNFHHNTFHHANGPTSIDLPSAWVKDQKNVPTEGVNRLSLDSSSRLVEKYYGRDIIDLDTDSDRATSVKIESSHRNGDLSRSRSPPRINSRPSKDSLTTGRHRDYPQPQPQYRSNSFQNKTKIKHNPPSQLSIHSTALPSSQKPAVQVILPPTPAQQAVKQKDIIRKLKEDADYIIKNPKEVVEVTGVRPFEESQNKGFANKKVLQKKRQPPVDRDSILLDFGDLQLADATDTELNTNTFIHPRKQVRQILRERFKDKSLVAPITFENSTSGRSINGKFQFISEYVFSRRVQARTQAAHPPRTCQCTQGYCQQECKCLYTELRIKVNGTEHPKSVRSYWRHPKKNLIVLGDELIEDTTHTAKIFECGDRCSCAQSSSTCINRVVQKGRTIPLQVFDTRKYGFGVRSPNVILRGQFVDIYLGEVLTEQETSRREAAAEEDTPSYIMSLDAFISDEKSMFYIDGENFGSVTRFVNHSCAPNCKIIPVVLPYGTKHVYYVAFFAIKDIPPGTELTIDYDPDLLLQVEDDLTDDVVLCQCGSSNCRKRLWAPGKEKRGRKKLLPSNYD